MKLAYLLAQYLYTNKRLDLPGIGTFSLDPGVIIENENNKNRSSVPEGISFENNPSVHNIADLVSYISVNSGKMKVLAEADLDSHLELAQQFLNISKPFLFEGIGTLVKLRPGELEFTQGNILTDKFKDGIEKEKHGLSKKETIEDKYQAYLATPALKSRWKKPVIALLIICGIGLAVLGGYFISTDRSETTAITAAQINTDPATQEIDSSELKKKDPVPVQPIASTNYKYILEISNVNKAHARFNQLKQTKLADIIQLEAIDSIKYKLFILLPISSDTTNVINSLTGFLGKKVYIEHQN